jgi:hypothetical protein
MKRFTYFASVVGREIECSNVNEVAGFANDVLQASLISPSMLYNYFSIDCRTSSHWTIRVL